MVSALMAWRRLSTVLSRIKEAAVTATAEEGTLAEAGVEAEVEAEPTKVAPAC